MTEKPDQHAFGKQAYQLTHDRQFWKFAGVNDVGEAAAFISQKCDVQALRFIDDSQEAVAKWHDLVKEFENGTR